MAEINVQRKGPGGWIWVVVILAVVGVVWVFAAMFDDDNYEATAAAPMSTAPAPANSVAGGTPSPEVAAFLEFTDGTASTGPAHEYAADGIRRLTRALNAVIEKDTVAGDAVRDKFEAFKAAADRIQADPQGTQHVAQVQDVFTRAADLMADVQSARWPDATNLQSRIAEVRTAAGALDTERPLLDQTTAVKTYFDRAGAALRMM